MLLKRILIISIIVLLIIVVYQVFLRDEKPEFALVEVVRGSIVQEVFESGQVEMGERINLTFKNAGRIEKFYAEVGDNVKRGQELAKIETAQLDIQLEDAKISLELAKLNMDKLLAGASPEEIKIAQTQVENAGIALGVAEQNLKNNYEVAQTILNSSYPQIFNALNFVREFIQKYISVYDEDARKITNARSKIESADEVVKLYLEAVRKDSSEENIEKALLTMRNSLETAFNNLELIRRIIDESIIFQNKVSGTDKASLDSLKINVNTALANIISSQQAVSSMKSSLQTARTNLREAENRLALVIAESRQVDIDFYQAQIKQAQVRVQLYENQLEQSKLISPVDGKIVDIKKRAGELVQPVAQDTVLVILSAVPYQIKVDIYEEDMIKMKIGNPVDITLIVFPDKIFKGKVISIAPTEKLVGGVVYYETTIDFTEEPPKGLKPGMTADIRITIASKENVLIIPENAIQEKNGKFTVRVFIDGQIEEREIEIGLRGGDDMVEVVSGLQQGEKVILN